MDVLESRIDTQSAAFAADQDAMLHLVRPDERVPRNQPLSAPEAMKMQYEIVAPRDGVIAQVCAPEGAQVASGATLMALDEDGAS